jgi:hydrogenase nickel incorporation protein HypA/HybF
MHELSVTQEIVDTVDEARRGAGENLIVTSVHIKIGRFTAVVPDYLRHYYEILTEGTPLHGAELHIELVPIVARCRECSAEFMSESPIMVCPQCNASKADVLQGRELLVESIEVDEME